MNNAKKIKGIGELLLVLGGILYVTELVVAASWTLTIPISILYAAAVVLMFIGWVGTRDERRAAKEAARAEKAKKEAA